MNAIADFAIDQAMHVIARILTGNRLKTFAQGLENLPAYGPAIIAARHYHHLFDGLAFFAAVERRFHFVVTLDWAQSRHSKFLMSTLNRLARWPMVLREDGLLCVLRFPQLALRSTQRELHWISRLSPCPESGRRAGW